jgi:hypothetical protein
LAIKTPPQDAHPKLAPAFFGQALDYMDKPLFIKAFF